MDPASQTIGSQMKWQFRHCRATPVAINKKRAIMKSAIVKRSVSLSGHKTSISLEDAFWNYLKEIAESRGVSVSVLVAEIQQQDRQTNLSSAIRLFVLEHARERCEAAEAVSPRASRAEITVSA
jgi:predicted DNA-binding ribbon-helix-helix protein